MATGTICMITAETIKKIYKKHSKRPESIECLNCRLLQDDSLLLHKIDIKDGVISINSVDISSPFHSIELRLIHAILDFESHVAIVLHSSIVFLGKGNKSVNAHIKPLKGSLLSRIKQGIGID